MPKEIGIILPFFFSFYKLQYARAFTNAGGKSYPTGFTLGLQMFNKLLRLQPLFTYSSLSHSSNSLVGLSVVAEMWPFFFWVVNVLAKFPSIADKGVVSIIQYSKG